MTTNEEIIERYADLLERGDQLTKMKEELKSKAIPEEVLKTLEEIDNEFGPMIDAAAEELTKLKAEIETAVLYSGESIKGTRVMAVWNKGRDGGWDTKKLEGYAMVHPEILGAKKPEGQPTVSFRHVK